MATQDFRQPGFAGGEITPSLFGRTDLPHNMLGLRTCRNFFIDQHGAAVSRPGSTQVGEAKLSGANLVRYKRFMVGAGTSFVLEFGLYYLRFILNGAYVQMAGVPLELVTPYVDTDLARLKFAQSGDVMTIVHPSYPPQQLIRYSNTSWTLQALDFPVVPGSTYWIQAPQNTSNICCLSFLQGFAGGQYQAGTTYAAGAYVWYTAVSGTRVVYMSLADGNLGNTPNPSGPTAWWAPAQDASHPAKAWQVGVTQVTRDGNGTVRESMLSQIFSGNLSIYIDRPAAWVFLWAPTAPPGTTVLAVNVYRGRNGLWGFTGSVAVPAAGVGSGLTFNDDGNTPDYATPPPQGGFPFQAAPAPAEWDGADFGYSTGTQVWWLGKVWNSLSNGNHDQPDLLVGGVHNWANAQWAPGTTYAAGVWVNWTSGSYQSLQAGNLNRQPDTSPTYWARVYTYPSSVGYFESRLVFGGAGPGVLENALAFSATGNFQNFDQSSLSTNPAQLLNPLKASSSLLFYLASAERDEIRSLVGLRSLLVLTGLGEWSIRGQNGGPLTGSSYDIKKHSRHGAAWLDPIVSNNVVLYVAMQTSRVRSLVYNFYADSYSGKDVSLHSEHLLRGHSIVDWDYAQVPYSILWAVRDDGVLLSLTYANAPLTDFERDPPIEAWARHDTNGVVEHVCVVPEGTEDAVYFGVKRGGRRFLERMSTRVVGDIRYYVGSDCATVFDGHVPPNVQFWADDGAGASAPVYSSAPWFQSNMVGQASVVLDAEGTLYPTTGYSAVPTWSADTAYAVDAVVQWQGNPYFALLASTGQAPRAGSTYWAPANGPIFCPVNAYTSPTQVWVSKPQPLPPPLRGFPSPSSGVATKHFSIANSLFSGQETQVLADGVPTTVPDGSNFTLATPALVVVAGLGFTAQLETLDLYTPKIELQSMHKSVVKAGVQAEIVYGLQATNTLDPTIAAPTETFTPSSGGGDPSYNGPPDAFEGFDHAVIQDSMSHRGRCAFTLAAPLPATILAIVRDVELAGS